MAFVKVKADLVIIEARRELKDLKLRVDEHVGQSNTAEASAEFVSLVAGMQGLNKIIRACILAKSKHGDGFVNLTAEEVHDILATGLTEEAKKDYELVRSEIIDSGEPLVTTQPSPVDFNTVG
jgi:hypothetical protein